MVVVCKEKTKVGTQSGGIWNRTGRAAVIVENSGWTSLKVPPSVEKRLGAFLVVVSLARRRVVEERIAIGESSLN